MTAAGATCLVAKCGSATQLTETIARALRTTAAARAADLEQRPAQGRIRAGGASRIAGPGDGLLNAGGATRLQSEFGPMGLLAELVDLFASQTPPRVSKARSAAAAGNAAAVSAGAHQLRGGCLTLAAAHMAWLCYRLEVEAGEGELGGATQLIDEIEGAFELTHAALDALARTPPE